MSHTYSPGTRDLVRRFKHKRNTGQVRNQLNIAAEHRKQDAEAGRPWTCDCHACYRARKIARPA